VSRERPRCRMGHRAGVHSADGLSCCRSRRSRDPSHRGSALPVPQGLIRGPYPAPIPGNATALEISGAGSLCPRRTRHVSHECDGGVTNEPRLRTGSKTESAASALRVPTCGICCGSMVSAHDLVPQQALLALREGEPRLCRGGAQAASGMFPGRSARRRRRTSIRHSLGAM